MRKKVLHLLVCWSIGAVVWEKNKIINAFSLVAFISFCKRTWSLSRTNMNLFYPKMFCVAFNWNWPSSFGEELMHFHYIVKIFPCKTRCPLNEHIWNPSTQECFVPSLIEIYQWLWRKRYKMWSFQTDNGQYAFKTFSSAGLKRELLMKIWPGYFHNNLTYKLD